MHFCYAKHLKTAAKIGLYLSVAVFLITDDALAHLDEQVQKASDLVLGNVSKLVVGGATLFGGGHALFQGNIAKGCAILGVGALTGIGIALAKSGEILKLMQ